MCMKSHPFALLLSTVTFDVFNRGPSLPEKIKQHEGKTHELEVVGRTSILEAALDEGIELPHDCKLGVCLTCPSMVVSGEVDQSEGTLDTAVVEQVRLHSRGRCWEGYVNIEDYT